MKKLISNFIFILILSVSCAYAGSTPKEAWNGFLKIRSQYMYTKGVESKMVPCEYLKLYEISCFLGSPPGFTIGDKAEIRMLRNNFYYGNLVADVLESGSYRMSGNYLNKKAPYDPDNFEFLGAERKLLREAAKDNYKFYTVKLISKGKNSAGVDTTGREVYMFLFFDEDNDFKGEIIAMK